MNSLFTITSTKAIAKDMRGVVVEHCGHWIPDERPDYLTQQFLVSSARIKARRTPSLTNSCAVSIAI
ncbi:hypothetical protein [Nostoc sp.]|uniref:hypothetical protein n=1 Tax=Nostoc sp. TaxID=1180 RepID=UPI002FF80517